MFSKHCVQALVGSKASVRPKLGGPQGEDHGNYGLKKRSCCFLSTLTRPGSVRLRKKEKPRGSKRRRLGNWQKTYAIHEVEENTVTIQSLIPAGGDPTCDLFSTFPLTPSVSVRPGSRTGLEMTEDRGWRWAVRRGETGLEMTVVPEEMAETGSRTGLVVTVVPERSAETGSRTGLAMTVVPEEPSGELKSKCVSFILSCDNSVLPLADSEADGESPEESSVEVDEFSLGSSIGNDEPSEENAIDDDEPTLVEPPAQPLRRSARIAARRPVRRSARLAAKPRVCYKGMC